MYGLLLTAFMIALHAVSFQTAISQNFNQFIPRGYELLDSQSGDLNQDGYTDYVIICKNPNEYEDDEAKRPLMILHGNPNGTLSLIARNDNVVLCFMCGGPMGDPYGGITIKKNFFSVEHAGGSSDQWTRIITFKYNMDDGNYYLSRDAGEVWNNNSKKPKKKLETYSKEQWGKTLFRNYVGE
jgi:hypothetical protein